jgi:mRNA interferase RelE/StbE
VTYRVEAKASVQKDLRRLPQDAADRILARVSALSKDPRPSQAIKLTGSDFSFRLRVGDYRVIYQIDEGAKLVTVYSVRHRKDAYR